jgi:transcriptional regulator with XRE-family HTH domain
VAAGDDGDAFRRETGEAVIANLKKLRAATDLSQEELSLRAKLSRNHVWSIENGKRFPQIDTVCKLAGALGVEPARLLEGFYWRPDEFGGDGQVTTEPPKESEN